MDVKLKTKLISALKELISNIKNGQCDNMTTEQYEKLIECLNVIIEIKQDKKKIAWKFCKL